MIEVLQPLQRLSIVLLSAAALSMSVGVQAKPAPSARAVSNEAALLRPGAAVDSYRRMPRAALREADAEDDMQAYFNRRVAADAPHQPGAILPSHAAAASGNGQVEALDAIVAPRQTYALMSAGLLSMALVVVRRRRQ